MLRCFTIDQSKGVAKQHPIYGNKLWSARNSNFKDFQLVY